MMPPTRRQVGEWAKHYLAGNLSLERFLELTPEEPDDDLVAELIDLLEHEPKRGGLLGATATQHDQHARRVREIIALLCATRP